MGTAVESGQQRSAGLELAIAAAGSVSQLARGLGVSQPSISQWKRVPAERVLAVEALTGVKRDLLRPDLYAEAAPNAAAAGADREPIDEIDAARANEYLLLARLITRPPDQTLLNSLSQIKGDASPLGMAHIGLAEAARATRVADAGREYFNLLIGVGRGDVLPYASFYRTGFLNERPLARVREDLARLGVERADGVHEPEDHLGTLLEVMAGLIGGEFAGGGSEQPAFFKRHIEWWGARCFSDIAAAPSAKFYRAVGEAGQVWLEIERQALALAE